MSSNTNHQASEVENDVLVDVQHVTYTHWNQTEPTLHDVSLQIRQGTLNVLVGPSGSGKSTLCDLFNGVIPHLYGGKLEGDIRVGGVNTREVEVKHLALKVGKVFQDPEIMFATLYVEDEIAFGPENLRFDVETIRQTVEELLELTDLKPYRHNLVWNLSGGQVQKLGLASVLAMRPQMIVLDEPTSNLDPAATRSVHDLVLSLRDEGITVLLVTRELDEFLAEADQLLVLADGRLLAAGPPRDVLREHGEYMLDSLGVWLPETSEIGIELRRAGLLQGDEMPITVEETLSVLSQLRIEIPEGASTHRVSSAPPAEVVISARDLHYTYPGGVEALKGISLDIRSDEWLMIVGRNGAGKSTLARLLVGLQKPRKGQLTLFGRDASRWKVQQLANNIALVFQNPEHQFLTDKVADEIGYSLLAQGVSDPAEIRRRTDEMLALLDLEAVADTHPFALSAGLKRRLGVATMLVGEPEVLLVDEPTYGQDREMTHTLMALMQNIRERGIAVVMITHDMRLVQEYAERVVVMSEGRILYDGSSAGLFEQEEVLAQANLRRTVLHDLVRAMREQGYPFPSDIRSTSDLVELLKIGHVTE
ncbi:MAG TPA: ABC transporter ATP-binding protein [Chloroflexi bacterium]|nr:ABC transporter ATP-binding protein [Chloroflexota bacterium]